mgnify:CR=1 FL=1
MNQDESNRLIGLEVLVRERSKIVDHRLDRFDQRFDRLDEQMVLVAQLVKSNGHNPVVEKSAWGAAAASLMVAVGAIGKAAGWW